MDEILHHFETMGHHYLLVFTGESSFQGFLGDAKWISSIHSRVLSTAIEALGQLKDDVNSLALEAASEFEVDVVEQVP